MPNDPLTTPPMSSDPTFQTRADLEAWSSRLAREAMAHRALGERTAMLDALSVIKRVTMAHIHLPFTDERERPA